MPSTLAQQLQQKYENKKVLVLGFGREGKSSYHLLRSVFPEKELFVMDRQKIQDSFFTDQKLILDQNYLQNVQAYDVIFKTAGIPISHPTLQIYLQGGGVVTSQSNEFLEAYHQQTIGV